MQEVVEMIAKINARRPNIPRVNEARKAYDALTPEQQAMVDNYSNLTAAEDRIREAYTFNCEGSIASPAIGIMIFVIGAFCFAIRRKDKEQA